MERRTEKDTHLTGLLMLGTAMGGQPINEIVDEMGRANQCRTISRKDFARQRSEHPLIWQALGFVFHEEEKGSERDRYLQPTTFPEGWSVKRTDHYMHNRVVDGAGRERGGFMYKPDFWDRDASAHLLVRFTTTKNFGKTPNGDTDFDKR